MMYLNDRDGEYVLNKYHLLSKPYDIMNRFVRNDGIFDPSTGMDGDEIIRELKRIDGENKLLPHPIRKALALRFVLENTRISCDPRDRYPAINAIDRPLNRVLITPWKNEVLNEIVPDVGKRRAYLEDNGIVAIWPDYDHSVPYWERVFGLGFKGILEDCEKRRTEMDLTPEQDIFFEGIRLTYEAIIAFIGRLADLAEKTNGSERMAKALRNIQCSAPATFYEAMLTDYIYFMISEHVDALQVRSLSNFDRIMYPYYQKAIDCGESEEEVRIELAYFLMQFASIDNYWGQPVFLGGTKPNGESEINPLSYTFLEVYDDLNIYNPKIQIKIAENTPKPFVLKALDMIRRGNNSIALVCSETIEKSMMRVGISLEDARLANVKGCYEYAIQCSFDCGMNYLNMMKPLEYALHEGCDGITGHFAGLKSPPLSYYDTFEKLYAEYRRQMKYLVGEVVEVVNGYEDYLSYINPLSMLSATYPICVENGRDAMGGGSADNISAIMYGFIGEIADSLTMLKKYVYDRGEISLSDFVAILDKNFEGHELFRRKLLNDREKYGNNKEVPDRFAVELAKYAQELLDGKPTAEKRKGRWTAGFHVARMSYIQAPHTAAAPNGRRIGDELSKNVSASMGQNREGATAAILSATKIDASAFMGDACLDLGLLPSAVKGDDGLEAMYGLLRTFTSRGGHALHINVFDADTLRDAQKNPDKYRDLQIRVCGWNVLWNNINKEEQDGFIRQAEALV